MKALLIVAHGSRKKESNDEITAMAKDIAEISGDRFDVVKASFIQFSPPYFEDQVKELVALGVTQLIVFPYFIGAGAHVTNDIPELIYRISSDYPDLTVTLTPHLGKFDGLKRMILEEIATQFDC